MSGIGKSIMGDDELQTLTGTPNADTLSDGDGSTPDTMLGGGGSDIFYVNNSEDSITESANSSKSQIYSTVSYTLPANVENLTLTGVGLYGAGNSSVDNIVDTQGNDTLASGQGTAGDILQGAGNDTYIVKHVSDRVIAAGTGNTVITSLNNYQLPSNVQNLTYTGSGNFKGTGNTQSDLITGSSNGNDILDGGGTATDGNADTLVGGNGNDTFIIHHINDVITAGSGINTIKSSVTFSLPDNVQNLILTGNSALYGAGNSLSDCITANTGNDTLDSTTNDNLGDTLKGGSGNDTYLVNSSNDIIVQTVKNKGIVLSNVSYTLPNNVANLTLTGNGDFVGQGNSAANYIIGGDGNDTLNGGVCGTAADTLSGGSGNNIYIIHHSKDVVTQASANGSDEILTTVSYTMPNNIESMIFEGSGNFKGVGNSLNDYIQGGNGNDTLDDSTGGVSGDTLVGGTGNDTFIIRNTNDIIELSSDSGPKDAIISYVDYTLPQGIANLTLSGTTNLIGTGNNLANCIKGGNGNDTLDGGVNSNPVQGDTLEGGAGSNTYIVNNTGDVIIQKTSKGIDSVNCNINAYTLASNIENLIFTGTGDFYGVGNKNNNLIQGGNGDDTLDGGSVGGTADTLVGGNGNDTFIIHHVGDLIETGTGINTILTYSNFTLNSNMENLSLLDTKGHYIIGNTLSNILTGKAGHDTLNGGGNEFDGSADTLIGIKGNDLFVVHHTNDVVTESSSAGITTVDSYVDFTLGSNMENLTIMDTSSGHYAMGNLSANVIKGSIAGFDTLDGGIGGTSGDTLEGIGGNDLFIINSTKDVISEKSKTGIDDVASYVNFTLSSNMADLVLVDATAPHYAKGNTLSNIIMGNSYGYDTLDGGGSATDKNADTLIGEGGNDIFIAHHTNDVLIESSETGINTVYSYSNYQLFASNLENIVIMDSTAAHIAKGNTLSNLIKGNSYGHDTLDGGGNTSDGSADTLQGIGGNDTFIVHHSTDVITEKATNKINTVESYVDFTLTTNLENLTIMDTVAGHYAMGNTQGNVIKGCAGNDTLDGGTGGTAADTLTGEGGNDTFIVHHNNDIVIENSTAGIDTVYSYANCQLFSSNIENLILVNSSVGHIAKGNTQSNFIEGSSFGHDTLDGGGNPSDGSTDTLEGVGGNDTFVIHHTNDVLIENSTSIANTVLTYVRFTLASNMENLTIMDTTSGHYACGNSLSNIITGSSYGHDMLDGGGNLSDGSVDTLIGVGGNDTFIVHHTNDIVLETSTITTNIVDSYVNYTLSTHLENLTLMDTSSGHYAMGNTLSNVITGNAGHDTLDGGGNSSDGSADTLQGIGGNDTFIVHHSTDIVTESADTGTDTVLTYVKYTLTSNMENLSIIDSISGHYAMGNSLSNIITGDHGSDTLDGGGNISDNSSDTLEGIGGNDTFVVRHSTDIVTESSSTTTNLVNSYDDFTLGANLENLVLKDYSNGHYAMGNTLSNSISGCYGSDTLDGGGNTSDGSVDTMRGIGGNDTFVIHHTNDVVIENSSTTTNTVDSYVNYTLSSHIENLTIMDTIGHYAMGDTLGNVITGNAGHDILDGSSGGTVGDTLQGVGGNDLFIVHHTSDVVTESSDVGKSVIDTYANFTLSSNIENLVILDTNAGHNVVGNTLSNIITGCSGFDTLDGGGRAADGNADTLIGVGGNDTFIVHHTNDDIIESNDITTNTVDSYVDFTLISNLENLTLMDSNAGYYAMGNTLNNVITGDHGFDTLDGGGNADDGNPDTLVGVGGNDTFIVHHTDDVITESNGIKTNTVNSYVDYTLSSNLENLTIMDTIGHYAMGNTLGNVITGNHGSDTLDGGAGGSAGDTLQGVGGYDLFIVHHSNDVVTESSSVGTSEIDTYANFTLSSNLENLTLMDTTGHYAMGNILGNVITGNAGHDTLDGCAGGTVGDTLIGVGGNDTFIVHHTNDVITENSDTTINTVNSYVDYTLSSNLQNLTLFSTLQYAMGNDLGNVITDCTEGYDTLDGSPGGVVGDTLIGNGGYDLFIVNHTTDVTIENSSIGNDTIIGSGANNNIVASAPYDNLFGGSGNDTYSIASSLGTNWGVITIDDPGGTKDVLNLSKIVASTAVTFSAIDINGNIANGNDTNPLQDLVIAPNANPSNYIYIDNYFDGSDTYSQINGSTGAGAGNIETIKFSDTSLGYTSIVSHLS